MSWWTPHTWSTGEALTNWKLNTEIRDRLLTLRNLQDHAVHLSEPGAASSTGQTIADSQRDAIRWNVVDWMVGAEIFNAGNPTRLLAPVAGIYDLQVNFEWDNSTGGARLMAYAINGLSVRFDIDSVEIVNSVNSPNQSGGDWVRMTTADYLEVYAWQNSGDAVFLRGGAVDRTRCYWQLLGEAT